jgi:hypothetical protein
MVAAMADSDEQGARPDRLAIAQQVIKSAGDVLRAAGFSRDEIGSFFRQAADHLETRADAPSPVPAGGGFIDQFAREFAESRPGREMAQLNAQVVGMGLPDRDAPLAGHFDLAMKLIPLIAEAQNALRSVASKAGLQVFADRRVGDAQAGAAALYFDDFQALWSDSFELLAALLAALSDRGDEEAFAFLLESLLENSVVISFELKETIERAAQAITPR